MDDLYREIIVERHKRPQNRGHLDHFDYDYEDENPFCGDHLHVMLSVGEDGKVTDAKFEGAGCAISTASADLLMEALIGMLLDEVKALEKEDILDMLGIELGPVRLKCALLSLKCVKGAVYELDDGSSDFEL